MGPDLRPRGPLPRAPPRSFLAERGEFAWGSKDIELRPRSPIPRPLPSQTARGEGENSIARRLTSARCPSKRVTSPPGFFGGEAGRGGAGGRSSDSAVAPRALRRCSQRVEARHLSPGVFGGEAGRGGAGRTQNGDRRSESFSGPVACVCVRRLYIAENSSIHRASEECLELVRIIHRPHRRARPAGPRPRGARQRVRALQPLSGGRRAAGRRRARVHRLQRGERIVRPGQLRRARGHRQGGKRGGARVHRHRRHRAR